MQKKTTGSAKAPQKEDRQECLSYLIAAVTHPGAEFPLPQQRYDCCLAAWAVGKMPPKIIIKIGLFYSVGARTGLGLGTNHSGHRL
jgi:hypothetical protein